jgi:hypothetical protein
MSNVAELRAKIAARAATDLARVDICIDRAQAEKIADLEADITRLHDLRQETLTRAKEDSGRGDRRLGDSPVAPIDTKIKTAEADLDTAWETAVDDTVVVVLRALPPEGDNGTIPSWQGLLAKHAAEFANEDYPAPWCADVAAHCFVRAETTDGDDLGYTWDELRPLLFHGDWERIWRQAIIHNRRSPKLDFSQRRSVSRRRAAK